MSVIRRTVWGYEGARRERRVQFRKERRALCVGRRSSSLFLLNMVNFRVGDLPTANAVSLGA